MLGQLMPLPHGVQLRNKAQPGPRNSLRGYRPALGILALTVQRDLGLASTAG